MKKELPGILAPFVILIFIGCLIAGCFLIKSGAMYDKNGQYNIFYLGKDITFIGQIIIGLTILNALLFLILFIYFDGENKRIREDIKNIKEKIGLAIDPPTPAKEEK